MRDYKSISTLLILHGVYLVVFGNWALMFFSALFLAAYLIVCAIEFVLFALFICCCFIYFKIKGKSVNYAKVAIASQLSKIYVKRG